MSENNGTLATRGQESDVLEQVVVNGDLKSLTPTQRVTYYTMRCEAAGLDPRTQPFDYITLQGKLTLYAKKTATEQLCEKRGLSVEIVSEGVVNDLYRVHARVVGKDGRHSDNIGIVTISGKRGDDLANAMMKAVTKAYRRAVLSHCGMGMLDETELETIRDAHVPVPDVAPTMTLPPPAEVPADAALLAEYDTVRGEAILKGFKSAFGKPPGPMAPGASAESVRKKKAALEAFLAAQNIPADVELVPPTDEEIEAAETTGRTNDNAMEAEFSEAVKAA